MKIWNPIIISTLIVSFIAFLTTFILKHVWKNESKTRNLFKNVSLSIFSCLYFFLILDLVFGLFIVHSDGCDLTLASKRWFQKYWKPINSYGYRDYEPNWKKKILFVVGDSFITGHGIKNIKQRLSSILARKLGEEWTVAVIAKNGWNLVDEYNALIDHNKRPHKIILSYFINDIESAATANNLDPPQFIKKPNRLLQTFVEYSFAINWFYWRIYKRKLGGTYWKYLQIAYSNPKIWKSHEQELKNIIGFAHQNGSQIVFIVWPNLNAIERSSELTSKVVQFLKNELVEVIDLTTHFSGRISETLVVNYMDGHPNTNINLEVAELVYKVLFPRK